MTESHDGRPIEPLRKSVTVPWNPADAFRRFTADLAQWWPLRSHSVGEERAVSCVMEGRVGGKIYETWRDGGRSDWGTVLAWAPPSRVAFTWHPGQDPSSAQQVDVQFTAIEGGTRVQLTHTGWEHYGREARRMRRAYGMGWGHLLQLYAGRRHALVVVLMGAMVAVMSAVRRIRKPARL